MNKKKIEITYERTSNEIECEIAEDKCDYIANKMSFYVIIIEAKIQHVSWKSDYFVFFFNISLLCFYVPMSQQQQQQH